MPTFGSPKRICMLTMGLILYIILVALLMFYIEECSVDYISARSSTSSGQRSFQDQCRDIYASFRQISSKDGTKNATNWNDSFEECVRIVRKLAANGQQRIPTCRFNANHFFPWVHTVTFSLMTIGGTTSPVTHGGQALLTLSTIIGIVPFTRLLIHTGVIICNTLERGILAFELRALNRSPRMIHNVHKKLAFFISLIIVLYNFLLAWLTALPILDTQWTLPRSISFWLQGMLTLGQPIEAADANRFYSNGGWKILCIDFAMVVNVVLFASLVCTVVIKMHKRHCHAAATIRKSFKSQNPEVYLHIKPLKTHL